MKIFKVEVQKVKTTDILVMANDRSTAERKAEDAVRLGDIEFDDEKIETGMVYEVDFISDEIRKEIRDFGIIDENSELIYEIEDMIENMEERIRKQEAEAYLKKHHLEFNLGF